MTADEALTAMRQLTEWHDTEERHVAADQILMDLLTTLGHTELVETYDSIKKWFA